MRCGQAHVLECPEVAFQLSPRIDLEEYGIGGSDCIPALSLCLCGGCEPQRSRPHDEEDKPGDGSRAEGYGPATRGDRAYESR